MRLCGERLGSVGMGVGVGTRMSPLLALRPVTRARPLWCCATRRCFDLLGAMLRCVCVCVCVYYVCTGSLLVHLSEIADAVIIFAAQATFSGFCESPSPCVLHWVCYFWSRLEHQPRSQREDCNALVQLSCSHFCKLATCHRHHAGALFQRRITLVAAHAGSTTGSTLTALTLLWSRVPNPMALLVW